jgi:hypothetical protein
VQCLPLWVVLLGELLHAVGIWGTHVRMGASYARASMMTCEACAIFLLVHILLGPRMFPANWVVNAPAWVTNVCKLVSRRLMRSSKSGSLGRSEGLQGHPNTSGTPVGEGSGRRPTPFTTCRQDRIAALQLPVLHITGVHKSEG